MITRAGEELRKLARQLEAGASDYGDAVVPDMRAKARKAQAAAKTVGTTVWNNINPSVRRRNENMNDFRWSPSYPGATLESYVASMF